MQLKQKVLKLKEKASFAAEMANLGGQKARVGGMFDISYSMQSLYRGGVVQTIAEKLLALAMVFDDDGQIDNFVFGEKAKYVGELGLEEIEGYVNNVILKNKLEYGTNYAQGIKAVIDQMYPNTITLKKKGGIFGGKELIINPLASPEQYPVYIIFMTDGNNGDKNETTQLITQAAHLPIFWQFVGIGNESFTYLKKLDDLSGRFIDNANFCHIPNIEKIDDDELYEMLLAEFPQYLKEARTKGLVA